MDTKEIFDRYFSSIDEVHAKQIRPQIDRPEVYYYEQKIGKQLIEMNEDELIEMLKLFNGDSSTGANFFAYNSYSQIASMYRAVFAFYSDNIQLIRNPWHSSAMRGSNATNKFLEGMETFTTDSMLDLIETIRKKKLDTTADYVECLILLFYSGFSKTEEIVRMQESDIDFKSNTISMYGHTVHLSERCAELLKKVHDMDEMPGYKYSYSMVPWHDSYFKFSIRMQEVAKFNEETIEQVAARLNRKITKTVKESCETEVSFRTFFYVGFYDYLVKKYGIERTNEMIVSVRVSNDVRTLEREAIVFGGLQSTAFVLKKNLRLYMRTNS